MDKADIEKFRRVGGMGETITIGNEKFYFKPLPLKHLPELMDFSRISQDEGALMIKENASRLFEIMKAFVTHSYPDLAKEEDVLDGFILNNMSQLQEVLIKTSTPKTSQSLSENQSKMIEEMKAKANEGKI